MQDNLLDDTEASLHLGITKELLYAYVRYAPKKALNHDRKLVSIEVDGKNKFRIEDLDEFDSYLKEPWSLTGDSRPEIPSYIRDYLKIEIGGRCPISGKGYPLDNAHIEDYSISRNHHHHNLIRIAKEEHTKLDNGILEKSILTKTKQRLIENTRQHLKKELNKINNSIRLPKPDELFIGREIELVKLVLSMEVDQLIIIQGIGGIGKTQLLLNAINNVIYHNPLIWIDVEAISTVENLKITISNEVSKIDDIAIGNNLIDTLSFNRTTIVLDSLEKLLIPYRDEIEDFIKLLMSSNNLQLLITSQIDLTIFDHKKTLIKLEGISNSFCEEIIHEILSEEIQIENEQLQWLLRFCGGHPLSLKLSGSLINFFRSVEKAIRHLEKADTLKQPLRSKYNKSNALSTCLNTIYAYLTNSQRKIIDYAKYFPGGVKKQWAESYIEIHDFDLELASLQQFFLLEIEQDCLNMERIVIKNPFRKFLYDKSLLENLELHNTNELETHTGISIEALIVDHYYIETNFKGSAEYGILRMESEFPNLMEAFSTAKRKLSHADRELTVETEQKYQLIVGNITSSLGKYFFVRGDFEQGILMAKEGIQISIKLSMYHEAASQYMYLLQIQRRQHDFKEYAKTLKDLEDFANSSKNNYAIIFTHWAKGTLYGEQENFKKAIIHISKAINLMKIRISTNLQKKKNNESDDDQLNISEEGNIGLMYADIGGMYRNINKFEKAHENYKTGLEIQVRLNDEVNSLSCYFQMAHCLIDLNQLEKAVEYYFFCIAGFKKHKNFEFLANTMAELGRHIENIPDLYKNDLLNEESYQGALNSIKYQLNNFLSRTIRQSHNQPFNIESIPIQIISQIYLITKLASFSEHRFLLNDWAIEIGEEFKKETEEISYFAALINLAHVIGSYDYWSSLEPKQQVAPIKTLHLSCLIINGGPDLKSKTRVFYWLSNWMRHTGLDKDATAEKLWDIAWEMLPPH